MKEKWQDFVKSNEFTTISMLIRRAVNFYIDSQAKIDYLEDKFKLSHDLKEPLTSIKGFSQLIFENYSSELDAEVLLRIKEIYNQSIFLEERINQLLEELSPDKERFDVLIIDDDRPTINVLTDFFQLKGFKCRGVLSGAKGLQELKKHRPKVILLDIILPDIDGYEACCQIKQDDELKNIPVYLMSAIPKNEIESKIEETGASGFLLKPFDFTNFHTILQYLES